LSQGNIVYPIRESGQQVDSGLGRSDRYHVPEVFG
jgi:hypothetical protein